MKKILPIVGLAILAAACTDQGDHDHYNNRTGQRTDVAPGYAVAPVPAGAYVTPSGAVVRPDGTYRYDAHGVVAVPGTAVVDEGHQHKHSEDALSDRSLGATRGSHGQPMTHKDADNDGNYDYVPSYRTRPATYYYTY